MYFRNVDCSIIRFLICDMFGREGGKGIIHFVKTPYKRIKNLLHTRIPYFYLDNRYLAQCKAQLVTLYFMNSFLFTLSNYRKKRLLLLFFIGRVFKTTRNDILKSLKQKPRPMQQIDTKTRKLFSLRLYCSICHQQQIYIYIKTHES